MQEGNKGFVDTLTIDPRMKVHEDKQKKRQSDVTNSQSKVLSPSFGADRLEQKQKMVDHGQNISLAEKFSPDQSLIKMQETYKASTPIKTFPENKSKRVLQEGNGVSF